MLALGVLLPLIALLFEWITGISAGVLFDPLPSWFQIFAVALVPAANLWLWLAGRAQDGRQAGLLGWLSGTVLGICLYYSVLYLPFVPFACIGIIWFGAGLIPLAPYMALVATLFLRASYQKRIEKAVRPRAWKGAALAFGVLVLLQMPTALTYYGLAQATSEDPASRLRGVRLLRQFGDKDLILRASYGLLRRSLDLDLVRFLASGNQTVTGDQAREIYYRVTGRPFNSVPPPSLYTRMGRWSVLDEEFTWDDALGGETVAGRVKGLALAGSRMDAVAEPAASVVYCEWTMEFKNVSRQPREARAQIALPPGGVVSRVTLWINGEEREAAFGGRSQVREAYQEVAVVRRRDPVLVTTCGPDRVLLQCFPVPPDGGTMKARIGITAPLVLASREQGSFVWPRFLERNFGISQDLKHARWIESPTALTPENGGPAPAQTGAGPFTLHDTVSEAALATSPETIIVQRPAGVGSVWTPAAEPGRIIRQTIQPVAPVLPARLVVVLDGSEGMQSSAREAAGALAGLPETMEVAVLIASDETKEFNTRPQKATASAIKEIQQSIGRARFTGGQDNLPALEAAWDLAAASAQGAVVWIHQPQPVALSSDSGLRQRLERAAAPVRLMEIQTRNGPDRIVEKLDGLGSVEHVVRLGSLRSDFDRLLSRWTGKSPAFVLIRELVAETEAADGTRVGSHIERLWARDEAMHLAGRRERDAAVKLAAENQLVTPLTGAVVLETREQYDRHNLKPADPTTVPAVPEPQTWLLMGAGMLAGATRRWFRRRSSAG